MMIGYALENTSGVYRMIRLDTMTISHARDIKWLNLTYGKYLKKNDSQNKNKDNDSSTLERNENDPDEDIEKEMVDNMLMHTEKVDSEEASSRYLGEYNPLS